MQFHVKKIFCAVLCALMMLSLFASCQSNEEAEPTLLEIANENNTKLLLETHDSVWVSFKDIYGMSFGYYVDDEIGAYWVDAYTDDAGVSHDAYCEITTKSYQVGKEGDQMYSVLYAGGEIDSSQYENLLVMPDLMAMETVESVEEKDGLLSYRTKLTIVDLVDHGYVAEADTIKDYYLTEYVVDAKTKHIKGMKEEYRNGNDEVISGYTCTVKYDEKRPDSIDSLLSEFENTSEFCTISVVKDVNTGKESTETYTIPKGNMLYFYWYGEYQNVYLDRDCTKAFTDASVIAEDTVLYLK